MRKAGRSLHPKPVAVFSPANLLDRCHHSLVLLERQQTEALVSGCIPVLGCRN